MSRSYKKTPIITDNNKNHRYSRRTKAIANRIVRRKLKDELIQTLKNDKTPATITNKKAFRKYFQTYKICDFKFDFRALDKTYKNSLTEPEIRKYYQK